jgi:LysM repeat protein
MSKKVIVLIALTIIASLFFAACERSAAPVVLATPTEAGATTLPTGISLVQAWGTSTAVAMQTAQAQGLISPTPSLTPTPNGLTPVVETLAPAVTTPIIVVPTLTPGRPATYTLQKGEFPYCIARRFNLNPADLLAANGLTLASASSLQPGLQLTIPASGSFPGDRALRAHPAQYTVQVDDSIYRIACYYGDVDPASIAFANGISVTTPLTTGQLLNIP